MSYLVSVVVPTKNRYKYLKYLIQLIDSFQLNELEFVIQDNSDNNDEIKEYLQGFANPNIKYYHSANQLSMSTNADLAILNSSGEYVCFIGDDDGVCRNIVDVVKWMKKNKIESVINRTSYFGWGRDIKLKRKKRLLVKYDAQKELEKLIKRGLILAISNLHLVYHSIVKREILDKVFKEKHTFFPSCPPDISGAIAYSCFIKEYYEINLPIIINGASIMAGGGVLKDGGVLQLKDVPFISQEDINTWEKGLVPPIWCGSYCWPNAGIRTLRIMKKEALLPLLDKNLFLARASLLYRKNEEIRKFSYQYADSIIKLWIKYVKSMCIIKFNKINMHINTYSVNNVETIVEAENLFSNYYGAIDLDKLLSKDFLRK